jgi:hypothetical protein
MGAIDIRIRRHRYNKPWRSIMSLADALDPREKTTSPLLGTAIEIAAKTIQIRDLEEKLASEKLVLKDFMADLEMILGKAEVPG